MRVKRNIYIVESEFQFKLASFNHKNFVYNIDRCGFKRFLDILKCIVFIYKYHSNYNQIIILDYRNIILYILYIFRDIDFNVYRNILIGDDGLHTLNVDLGGEKKILNNCSKLKYILLKNITHKYIKIKRIYLLTNYLNSNLNYSSYIIKYKNIFIDQPFIDIESYEKVLSKYKIDLIIIHPRSNIKKFSNINIIAKKFNDIETILFNNRDNIEQVIGVSSTLLLISMKLGIKTKILLPIGNVDDHILFCNKTLRLYSRNAN